MKKVAWIMALVVILAGGIYAYGAASVTITSTSGTPFKLVAIATGAATTIAVPDNDILIYHTGIQSDGSTPSVSGDYVTVMNAYASDGTTGTTMVSSYAAGDKLNIPSGSSATFRGCDTSWSGVDGVKEIIVQANGHGAMIQIVKGSVYGNKN